MRIAEVFQVVPSFILAAVIVALSGPGLTRVVSVIALLAWPQIARLMRGEVMRIKGLEFVDAVRCLGVREPVILATEVIPERARARARRRHLDRRSGDPARSRAQLPRPLQRRSRELGPHAQQRPALSLQCLVALRFPGRGDLPHRARLQPLRRRHRLGAQPETETEHDVADRAPILRVEDLGVTFRSRDTAVRPSNGASLTIREGEAVGLVGESGSGKSTLARAVLGLNPERVSQDRSGAHPHRRPRRDAPLRKPNGKTSAAIPWRWCSRTR